MAANKGQDIGATVWMWFWSLVICVMIINIKCTEHTILRFSAAIAVFPILPLVTTLIRYIQSNRQSPMNRPPGSEGTSIANSK